jgi:hypothetical protein
MHATITKSNDPAIPVDKQGNANNQGDEPVGPLCSLTPEAPRANAGKFYFPVSLYSAVPRI